MAITGLGTENNPYILTDPSDFDFIRNNVASNYKLGNDIDFNGATVYPLGNNSNRFNSTFDGDGYTIKNLYVPIGNEAGALGLFGVTLLDAKIRNVKFENMNVDGGQSNLGGMLSGNFFGEISNVHIQGSLNITSSTIGRVGGLVGLGTETNNRFKLNNVYTEITIDMGNARPANTTSMRNIGGVVGVIGNDNTNPSTAISNVVANNILIGNDLSGFNIGRFVGSRTYDNVQYENIYTNASNFPTTYTDPFQIVTDTTIKQPLQLDSNYWIQNEGEVPKLRSFVKSNGSNVKRETIINFNKPSVTIETFKSITLTTLPIKLKPLRINSESFKRVYVESKVITDAYNVLVDVSNAQMQSRIVDISFNQLQVTSTLNISLNREGITIPFNPIQVNINVEYPTTDDKPVYAIVYAIESNTSVYTIENSSSSYAIENNTILEVR